MVKADVSIGKTYVCKVSGKLQAVTLVRECTFGGWYGINILTKREVRIRTAARLRREYHNPPPKPDMFLPNATAAL